jgi:hypothetical protein
MGLERQPPISSDSQIPPKPTPATPTWIRSGRQLRHVAQPVLIDARCALDTELWLAAGLARSCPRQAASWYPQRGALTPGIVH